MLQTYRAVLARPGALAFSSAGALARLPMSMVGIAVVLAVSDIYGSYGLAGQITAVYVITHAICAPQLARLVDRYGQARVMRPAIGVATAGMAGMLVALLVVAHPAWLFAAGVVTGASIGSVGALVRARWTHLLRDPRAIHTAYSLESAVDELVFIVGPIVATVLATNLTPTAGLWLPTVAALGGGLLLFAQHGTEPPVVQRDPGAPRQHLLRSAGMVVLTVVFVGMGAIFGATDVATVAFAEEQGAKSQAGTVLAVFALGSMLSGLLYGARHWLSPLWRRFAIGVVGLAVGVSLFFLVTSLPMLAAVMFVTGFSIAPTLVNGNGLVQELVRSDQLTEGLTWVGTALGVGVSVGASIAGSAIDRVGAHGGFLVVIGSAGLAVVATLVALPTLRRDARAAASGGLPDDAAPVPATSA
jgi:MFS family permease